VVGNEKVHGRASDEMVHWMIAVRMADVHPMALIVGGPAGAYVGHKAQRRDGRGHSARNRVAESRRKAAAQTQIRLKEEGLVTKS